MVDRVVTTAATAITIVAKCRSAIQSLSTKYLGARLSKDGRAPSRKSTSTHDPKRTLLTRRVWKQEGDRSHNDLQASTSHRITGRRERGAYSLVWLEAVTGAAKSPEAPTQMAISALKGNMPPGGSVLFISGRATKKQQEIQRRQQPNHATEGAKAKADDKIVTVCVVVSMVRHLNSRDYYY